MNNKLIILIILSFFYSCNETGLILDSDNGGLLLPDGFGALVVSDGVGESRHIAVNTNGDILQEYTTTDQQMNLDISNYPSGSYFIYFTSGKETLTNKIILNK